MHDVSALTHPRQCNKHGVEPGIEIGKGRRFLTIHVGCWAGGGRGVGGCVLTRIAQSRENRDRTSMRQKSDMSKW